MKAPTLVVASLMTLLAVPTLLAAHSKVADVIPVMLNFGDYVPANEKLMNLIGDELQTSRYLVQNVDAPTALEIKARFTGHSKRTLHIAYIWSGRTLAQANYSCRGAQLKQCAIAIVRDAERVSRSASLR